MPRDYKNRPRGQARKGAPGWAWLLVGLMIGLFVAFLVYLKDRHGLSAPISVKPTRHESAPPHPAKPASEAPKTRFEFYTILPEMEVPVQEEALPRRATKPTKAPQEKGTYLLQVASFRSHQEADRLKASLALLGMEADIQTVSIDGKVTWHRVRMGPFSSFSRANEVRQRLRAHDLDAMVLKVKT